MPTALNMLNLALIAVLALLAVSVHAGAIQDTSAPTMMVAAP